jgi:mannosyl-3-phosphoglycerate phosphatase
MKIGAVMPPYNLIRLGKPYSEIRRFLEGVKMSFGLRGFGDLTIKEIAELAGMPEEKAKLAKEREFTEPFLMEKKRNIDHLQDLAFHEDIKITRGGRFYHFIGAGQDKGEAVKITKVIFRQRTEEDIIFVGIGDSANDLPMLENVDIPVLIPHPDGSYEKIDFANLTRAAYPGSTGWSEAIERILDDFERNHT